MRPLRIVGILFLMGGAAFSSGCVLNSSPTAIRLEAPTRLVAAPFELVDLQVSGHDPTANLWLRLVRLDGTALDVPAIQADATRVRVVMPPYIDPFSGDLASGVVSFAVVQQTSTGTSVSNVVPGLFIQALPETTLPAGLVTLSFLYGTFQFVEQLYEEAYAEPGTDPTLTQAFAHVVVATGNLYQGLAAAGANGDALELGVFAGELVEFGEDDAARVDRLILGMLDAEEAGADAMAIRHAPTAPAIAGRLQSASPYCLPHDNRNLERNLEDWIEGDRVGELPSSQEYWNAVLECLQNLIPVDFQVVASAAGQAAAMTAVAAAAPAALPALAFQTTVAAVGSSVLTAGTQLQGFEADLSARISEDGWKLLHGDGLASANALSELLEPPEDWPSAPRFLRDIANSGCNLLEAIGASSCRQSFHTPVPWTTGQATFTVPTTPTAPVASPTSSTTPTTSPPPSPSQPPTSSTPPTSSQPPTTTTATPRTVSVSSDSCVITSRRDHTDSDGHVYSTDYTFNLTSTGTAQGPVGARVYMWPRDDYIPWPDSMTATTWTGHSYAGTSADRLSGDPTATEWTWRSVDAPYTWNEQGATSPHNYSFTYEIWVDLGGDGSSVKATESITCPA